MHKIIGMLSQFIHSDEIFGFGVFNSLFDFVRKQISAFQLSCKS